MPEGLTEDELADFAGRFAVTRDGLRSLAGDQEFEDFAADMLEDQGQDPSAARLAAIERGKPLAVRAIEARAGVTLETIHTRFGVVLDSPVIQARGAGGRFVSLDSVADKLGGLFTGPRRLRR